MPTGTPYCPARLASTSRKCPSSARFNRSRICPDSLPITAAANAFVRRFVLFFPVVTFVTTVTAFLERDVLQSFPKKAAGAVLLIFIFRGELPGPILTNNEHIVPPTRISGLHFSAVRESLRGIVVFFVGS